MERTKLPGQSYPLKQEPIVLSKPLLDLLLAQPNPPELIGLYCFYYYTAKWQGTNQPRATTGYAADGMKWGVNKLQKIKKQLINLRLIENVRIREDNKITGHFIRVNFVWRNGYRMGVSRHSKSLGIEESIPNALSTDNINALSTISIFIIPSMFEKFWKLYPKKADKGKALSKWKTICSRSAKDKPTWRVIKSAILQQIKTDRWQDPEFIPNPTTWLNQSRWLDDPKEMKSYNRKTSNKPKTIIEFGRRWTLDDDGDYINSDGEILS